ncbi:hypothetical protein KC325_g14 [Hortaea werneckii]|nr:hypothetical protein KC325_g14 [Hortaea werneckii]
MSSAEVYVSTAVIFLLKPRLQGLRNSVGASPWQHSVRFPSCSHCSSSNMPHHASASISSTVLRLLQVVLHLQRRRLVLGCRRRFYPVVHTQRFFWSAKGSVDLRQPMQDLGRIGLELIGCLTVFEGFEIATSGHVCCCSVGEEGR